MKIGQFNLKRRLKVVLLLANLEFIIYTVGRLWHKVVQSGFCNVRRETGDLCLNRV